jgi:orotate phosphoribosyltransferase
MDEEEFAKQVKSQNPLPKIIGLALGAIVVVMAIAMMIALTAAKWRVGEYLWTGH